MVLKIEIETDPDNMKEAVSSALSAIYSKSVDEAITSIGPQIKNLIQGRSPVGIGTTSGNFKAGWSGLEKLSGGISYKNVSGGSSFKRKHKYAWSNSVPYGIILEEGLYSRVARVSPRTVRTSTGIYSTQAVEGVLKPLVEDTAFADFVLETIVKRIEHNMRKG